MRQAFFSHSTADLVPTPPNLLRGFRLGLMWCTLIRNYALAWRRGLEDALAEHPDEIAPYHLLPAAYEAVSEVVRSCLGVFGGTARAVA